MADDAERLLAAQPLPTWLCDMETLALLAASDSAGALFGVSPAVLRKRNQRELLPGFDPAAGGGAPVEVALSRPDGAQLRLELRRETVSYAGRPSWLTIARDVTRGIRDAQAPRALGHYARPSASTPRLRAA